MKEDDIKTARAIIKRVNDYPGPERAYLISLMVSPDSMARTFLGTAREVLGVADWIEAGLNCKKDEDVVPEALADFFTDLEPEVIHAGEPN